MSRLERLVPSASTLARTVGTGLPTFPLGLTEEMVMAPPEPLDPPLLLVADPVRLVALLTVRSTAFLGFGTCEILISAGFALLNIIPQRVVHQTLVGKDRSPLPSSYSPNVVEGDVCEVRIRHSA